jgi:pilus assembly protein Flp/PilA
MTKRRDRHDDEGASAVEYALIVGAIAAVLIAVIVTLGTVVHSSYSNSCGKIGAAMSSNTANCSK